MLLVEFRFYPINVLGGRSTQIPQFAFATFGMTNVGVFGRMRFGEWCNALPGRYWVVKDFMGSAMHL
jgi:hypothetical protein